MSHKPSYSLDNIIWVTLPGHYKYGGQNKSKDDFFIHMQTDSGVEFFYDQFTQRHFDLMFLVAESDLVTFQNLDDAVGGVVPFYFRLNLPSEGFSPTTYFVMKEGEFRPEEEDPAEEHTNIGPEPFYSFRLRLRERLT